MGKEGKRVNILGSGQKVPGSKTCMIENKEHGASYTGKFQVQEDKNSEQVAPLTKELAGMKEERLLTRWHYKAEERNHCS